MHISVNNNTNFKKNLILSIRTIWDRLRQKTISRYCPFKLGAHRAPSLTQLRGRDTHVLCGPWVMRPTPPGQQFCQYLVTKHHRAKWTKFFKDLIKNIYEFLTFYAFCVFLCFLRFCDILRYVTLTFWNSYVL